MGDWFKGFFGFPGSSKEGTFDPFQDFFNENPRMDGEDDNDSERRCMFDDRFGSFHHQSPFTEATEMFKHFEEMFRNIGLADFPPPAIGPQEPLIDERDSRSLRDKMLKVPDADHDANRREGSFFSGLWNSARRSKEPIIDTDLDDKVAAEGLCKIVPFNGETSLEDAPQCRSQHSYISIRTIKSADGKVEEHRTVKDSNGNVNTTMRRSLGDQSHAVTTKSDKTGQSERREDFINMDESSLDDFEKRWQEPRYFSPLNEVPESPRNELLKEKSPSYFSIFRKFLGMDPHN